MSGPITVLLDEYAGGDKTALNRLLPLVYSELRTLAGGYLRREKPGHTLQPTALVNEAYMRLIERDHPGYRNRAHFVGVAAHVMRQILIDHARTKGAAKRGGNQAKFSINEALDSVIERPAMIVALDDALQALEAKDPRKAQLVEMRYFGGLTAAESAEVLNVSVDTVRSELRVAQAWLQRELKK